jgi:ATP-dependent Clp protease ATP-binding subunit ClpA
MDINLSIHLIWQLAAHEAKVAEHERIGRAHVFMAILKFAEMEPKHIEMLDLEPGGIETLRRERNVTGEVLAANRITVPELSRKLRRQLRKEAGRGQYQHAEDAVIHRSDACRRAFHLALENAHRSESSEVSVSHLLTALLEMPSDALGKALFALGIAQPVEHLSTPILDQYGRNLAVIATCECPKPTANAALLKTVIDLFSRDDNKSMLLICTGKDSPRDLLLNVSLQLSQESASPVRRHKQIIELTLLPPAPASHDIDAVTVLERALEEAARSRNISLFLPDFDRLHDCLRSSSGLSLMKKHLGQRSVQCIGSLGMDGFSRLIEDDRSWKGFFRCIWMHDLHRERQL